MLRTFAAQFAAVLYAPTFLQYTEALEVVTTDTTLALGRSLIPPKRTAKRNREWGILIPGREQSVPKLRIH